MTDLSCLTNKNIDKKVFFHVDYNEWVNDAMKFGYIKEGNNDYMFGYCRSRYLEYKIPVCTIENHYTDFTEIKERLENPTHINKFVGIYDKNKNYFLKLLRYDLNKFYKNKLLVAKTYSNDIDLQLSTSDYLQATINENQKQLEKIIKLN